MQQLCKNYSFYLDFNNTTVCSNPTPRPPHSCREARDAALAAEVAARLDQQEQLEVEEREKKDRQLAREIATQEKARIKEKKELKQVSESFISSYQNS